MLTPARLRWRRVTPADRRDAHPESVVATARYMVWSPGHPELQGWGDTLTKARRDCARFIAMLEWDLVTHA